MSSLEDTASVLKLSDPPSYTELRQFKVHCSLAWKTTTKEPRSIFNDTDAPLLDIFN